MTFNVSDNVSTLTDNGDSNEVEVVGPVAVCITGDFGGGTATIKREDSGGTYRDLANGALTVAADKRIEFPKGAFNKIKVTLAGATSPNLVISIQGSDEPG